MNCPSFHSWVRGRAPAKKKNLLHSVVAKKANIGIELMLVDDNDKTIV